MTSWLNFIIFVVLFVDTFAIWFLIKKVKVLESTEEKSAEHRRYLAGLILELEKHTTTNKESAKKIGQRVLSLEKKLKAILDEE